MAKNNTDLFDRLRRVGLRKQVAKSLSQITEDAGKKARQAAHDAIHELRMLADELEHRITGRKASAAKPAAPGGATAAKPAEPAASGGATAAPARPAARRAAAPAAGAENRAKILAALEGGPKTASEIAKATGISASTVSSALRRLAAAGEVVKAARGYALPS